MLDAPRSSEEYERACKSLAMGASSSLRRNAAGQPLYFDRGDGPHFIDLDGHTFLDYTLGFGPLIVGSNHPKINQAVRDQLERSYTFGASHIAEVQLAEKLVGLLPGIEQIALSNTGTEAVQVAIRLARAFTRRSKVVRFEGHYHGWMNNIMVRPALGGAAFGEAAAVTGGQPSSEFADTLVVPWNDTGALYELFEKHPETIACVICEPLPNTGGCEPEAGYLASLIELCRQNGSVSIFDEVVTGFRLALGGAREYFGVQADLSIYGKALGGGFPISAVGGRAAVFDPLWQGTTLHAGTYNGNSVAVAAALATLDLLKLPGTYEAIRHHGRAIRDAIEAAARDHDETVVTSGADTAFCVLFGLESPPRSYSEALEADIDRWDWFRAEMLIRGVYLLPEGRWFVGSAHDDAALGVVTQAIEESFSAICDPEATPPPRIPGRVF